jgi:hypothetical protein
MSTDLVLDPDRINQLEPSEGDERQRIMLSPSAVPHSISVNGQGQSIGLMRFSYHGEEAPGPVEAVDDQKDPQIAVRVSALTQKVLELRFSPPAESGDLQRIAERLDNRAREIQSLAKRLSYRMIARVLREWGPRFISTVAQMPS